MALNISSGSRYFIVNTQSGTVIDVASDLKVNGYKRVGGDNQQWDITYTEGGWLIKNVQFGKYLGISDGDPKDGSVVRISSDAFIWHLWPDTAQVTAGRICVPSTALNVDLDKGSFDNGTDINVWGRHEGWNQVWRFEKGIYPLDSRRKLTHHTS
ncbi:hypothetical protein JR316_0012275 [Psilocybe cubensis]|uniref:Uncharacterized protein n=2 Tax=Psilocybe cubensis TaxID=181762 RepID=A0ACB8GHS6_PSICU|nr:hypothetical protein JR316_0012275 [Psilocybe cubensis]KAH9475164.1 hypothetical protein JR316_0012275 [Psilocybe cubensis]